MTVEVTRGRSLYSYGTLRDRDDDSLDFIWAGVGVLHHRGWILVEPLRLIGCIPHFPYVVEIHRRITSQNSREPCASTEYEDI
jgi:hypothetical protein